VPAYLIADIEVTEPEVYERYREAAGASLAAHGGRFVVRGGAAQVLEGDWTPRRLIVLEFGSLEAARSWYHSPEYTAAKELRLRSADSRLVLVEGAEPPADGEG
jgi:uncharacterized protein (DUF1330 family)